MLSEQRKAALRFAVEESRKTHGNERLCQIGPRRIVEFVRDHTIHAQVRQELTENQEEAERYLAGLMGMM